MKTIKSLLFLFIVLFSQSFALEAADPKPDEGLTGSWQGVFKPTPAIELRLVLALTNTLSGKPQGAIISIDQGNITIPITAFTKNAGAVHLEIRRIGGVFDGKLNDNASEIAGNWKQGGQSLPLTFKRLDKVPRFSRPQEPQKPFPYEELDVTVESATSDVRLAGTLTLPYTSGLHPAVVLIAGTGPEDRNEAIMGHKPFLVLADYLTRHGIAVLRCDKRGVGKSSGDFARATDRDFVEDTLSCVDYLQKRKDIDPKHIGLIGHSEGGTVAPMAAVKSTNVSFVVLLAGIGVSTEEVLVKQGEDVSRAMGLSEEFISKNTSLQRQIFRIIREEKDPDIAEKALRNLSSEFIASLPEAQRSAAKSMFDGQIQMMLTPWFREMLVYDPRSTLKAVKCPVLAINGDKDVQVSAKENLAAIREALESGGNPHIKILTLPGLNHLFQTCQTGAITEYGHIEETISPVALNVVSDWIHDQTSQ